MTTVDSISLRLGEIPVRGDFDVLVVGGGLAGCCAALASARNGARTLLAESLPFVGGNGTIGLPITTFCASGGRPPLIVGGIAREILEKLRKTGGFDSDVEKGADWMPVDGDLLQICLAHMLDGAGVTLLCHSPLLAIRRDGSRLTHAVFLGKDECAAFAGKCFVDCTGDAAVAFKAGLATPMGRARDGKTQPMTLTFAVSHIDQARFESAGGCRAMVDCWMALHRKEKLCNPRIALSCPTFYPWRPGEASFNVTRILVEKGTDARQLTMAEMAGRFQVEEFVERLLRPLVPGFENCRLSRIAHRIGVRETRRIEGEYELQPGDLLAGRKFPDSIACNSYPVDIHNPEGGDTQYETESIPPGAYYTVPYRSLVAKGADNLLAAGRCLSASHEALAAVRILSCAMPTGEAAGVAAALSARRHAAARDVDVVELRTLLRQQGAIVD